MIKYTTLICLFIFFSCNPKKEKITLENLKSSVEDVFSKTEGDFAFAFLDLSDPGNQLLINADENFHAASTMKTPVMIELFKQAAEGKFNLDDIILIRNEFKSIVDGSSFSMDITEDSQEGLYDNIGDSTTIFNLMYEMITVSSNLATNILIELVDAKKVTATMRTLGADNIQVLRGVEDQKAYDQGLSNSTTARDMLIIMQAIAEGKAGNPEDTEMMISILMDQKWNEIIPRFLPARVKVAHKTGTITGLHHDTGIVFLPDGRAYVLILMSKNLGDFEKGTGQLAWVSKLVYDFMTQENE